MSKRLFGIRGATCTENDVESIKKDVCAMFNEIYSKNKFEPRDIVSIQFSVTEDIDAYNPAAALRHGVVDADISSCALFCSVEPHVKNTLPKTIRALITVYMDENSEILHSYRNGAEVLRPDFCKKVQ